MEPVMEVIVNLDVLNLIILSMQVVVNFHLDYRIWSDANYNSGYGWGMYGSCGGLGGSGGLYSNNMHSGYGMGMGSPYATPDTNNPYGPPSPPGFWTSFVRVMQGVINFFGRISVLIVQNTQAFYIYMLALLQLFDRSGLLYGELARFVLRLPGIKTRPGKHPVHLPAQMGVGSKTLRAQKLLVGGEVMLRKSVQMQKANGFAKLSSM
ncbi:hypothetical protein COCNU_scaffold021281G000010 [Cocos nucifera]|nr:hypothetical protein [Cocos nucifera]